MRTTMLVVVATMLAVFVILRGAAPAFAEANFVIEIFDDRDFGFYDPTPVDPVGGNRGKTLGDQRIIALREAARIWGEVLDSTVEIKIAGFWEDTDAILGLAGTGSWARGFRGAIRPNAWYSISLANKLAAVDLCPPEPDGECSVDWDMALSFGARIPFYLGLDGDASEGEIDLVTIGLHEIAHGLGFSSKGSDEHRRAGNDTFPVIFYDSIYHVFVEGGSLTGGLFDLTFPQMTEAQRSDSVASTLYLQWVGPRGSRIGAGLDAGYDEIHGHVLLDASTPRASLLHLNHRVTPNNFMEARYGGPAHDTTLAYSLLADMGWEATCPGDCDADGRVTVSELVRAVRMALGQESLVRCAILNTDNQGRVRVQELIRAVNSSLEGCAVDDVELLERPLVRVEQASRARVQARVQRAERGSRESRLGGPAGGVVSSGDGVAYALVPEVGANGKAVARCIELAPEALH